MKRFWSVTVFIGLSLTAILLTFLSFSVAAQDLNNFQIEKVQGDGLFNYHVGCFNQDKYGFIWVGTTEGLYRYDGYSFKAFRNFPDDPATLLNNRVQCLFAMRNDLWVGTWAGLSRINATSQAITNFKSPGGITIYTILQKNDSVLWAGTHSGLYEFSVKTYRWVRVSLIKSVSISAMCRKRDSLYIGTNAGGFIIYDLLTGKSKYYNPFLPAFPNSRKRSLLGIEQAITGTDGNVWISSWGNGLVRLDPRNRQLTRCFDRIVNKHPHLDSVTTGLVQDNNRNIWVADREGGVVVFNPEKNELADYPVQRRSESELSGAVRSLFRDRSGIIWIGTEDGVFKYDPHRTNLSKNNFLQKTATGMHELQYPALSISQKQKGQWWLGTYEGLFLYDERSGVLKDENKQMQVPPTYGVYNIATEINGTTWFTAKNVLIGLRKMAGTNKPLVETYRSKDVKTTISAVYTDKEKRMWVGTFGSGIFRFDKERKTFIPYPYHEMGPQNRINAIQAFCQITKDSILVGGENAGLFLMNTTNGGYRKIHWRDEYGKDGKPASIFCINKIGPTVWIGTQFAGLWQTDSTLKTRKLITVKDGLPSMSINSMVADNNGNIWLVTYSGIVKVRLKDKKILVFDKKDGIESMGDMQAIDADSDGAISVSDRGCIYHFNPTGNQKNTVPPAIFLTGFKVFDTDHEFQKDSVVNLNYDQNYFSFNYVALNYTQSNLNKYAYKMQGLDENWTDASDRRYASYANLPEGRYVFMVKASNNEGVWSTAPAKLVLIINPPFWHRWWFYLLCVVAALGVLYAFYLYKINTLKMRLQLRDRIATDFHDELGSTLSSIALYSEMAMIDDFADKQRTKNILTQIGDSSRLMVLAMQDMIWAIQPKNDKMQEVIYRIREYAYPLAELKKIDIKLHIEEGVQDIVLSMDARKNIYLIFKEALNNAFKYASAKNITLTMSRQQNLLCLTIKDDGSGFDDATVKKGNGLANMQKRAILAGGKLYISSGSGKGTTIIFDCRII